MSMKNFSDIIGNRTRDLPTCSAVPQPTAPPAACPFYMMIDVKNYTNKNRSFRQKRDNRAVMFDVMICCNLKGKIRMETCYIKVSVNCV
jgi:hypothetical protein